MKVATTTITIPEDLSEITLGQYQHYIKVCEGLEGDALSQRTVNVLCDIKLHDVMMLRLTDIREIEQHLHALFKMDQELQTTFKIKAQEFGFITDLEAISFGEYVDLDKYMNDWETMHKAMAVLYRPTTKRIDDKYNIIEYEGTEDYADLMRFMPLDVALGAMVFFLPFRKRIIENYPKLFTPTDGGTDEGTDFSEQAQFNRQWGWYNSIYALARGDIRAFDDVTRIRATSAFAYLTYEAQKNEIERNMMKKAVQR